jgi:hypothetical protein
MNILERIQLIHPEGKKAVTMERGKYEVLKTSFLDCLKAKRTAPFKELVFDVTADLDRRKIKIDGVIEWNLFWVMLDMESRNELKRDKTLSPQQYSL